MLTFILHYISMSETPKAPRSSQETVDEMKRMIRDYRDAGGNPIDLGPIRVGMESSSLSASYLEGYLWQNVTAYPDLQEKLIQLLAEDYKARGEQDYFSDLAEETPVREREAVKALLPAQFRPIFNMRLNQVLKKRSR